MAKTKQYTKEHIHLQAYNKQSTLFFSIHDLYTMATILCGEVHRTYVSFIQLQNLNSRILCCSNACFNVFTKTWHEMWRIITYASTCHGISRVFPK